VILETEVQTLCLEFEGLDYTFNSTSVTVKGVISFHANYEGLESIEDWFEIEIVIPEDYPTSLPAVTELQGKVRSDYEHLYSDGTFCLAPPLAERQAFNEDPTLLGFFNHLVIPYLYSYCYWEKHGSYPFGDRPHGFHGLIEHYLEIFETQAKPELRDGLERIVKYGYRGHHPCPCGSGIIIRNCHKEVVRSISDDDARHTLGRELKLIHDEIEQAAKQRKK